MSGKNPVRPCRENEHKEILAIVKQRQKPVAIPFLRSRGASGSIAIMAASFAVMHAYPVLIPYAFVYRPGYWHCAGENRFHLQSAPHARSQQCPATLYRPLYPRIG